MSKHKLTILANLKPPFSQRFLDSFVEQLTAHGFELTGLDFSKFCLACAYTVPYFGDDNIGRIGGDLLGPDNFGHPARAAWRCETHSAERIAPDNPLDPEGGHQLCVWWEDLSVEELRSRYLNPPRPHIPDVGDVSFEIEWSPWWQFDGENLIFELHTQHKVGVGELKRAQEVLWQKVTSYRPSLKDPIWQSEVEKWNMSEDNIHNLASQGFANYWTGIRQREDQGCYIAIDFLLLNDQVVVQ